jgi:hypothetical protein
MVQCMADALIAQKPAMSLLCHLKRVLTAAVCHHSWVTAGAALVLAHSRRGCALTCCLVIHQVHDPKVAFTQDLVKCISFPHCIDGSSKARP